MNRLFNARHIEITKERRIVKNSEVIKIGDWITDEAAGVANADDVNESILGLVTAVLDKNGVNLLQGNSQAITGGSWVVSTLTFTADSDNETVDMVQVEFVRADEGVQFVATLDANKGTTTGSNKAGYYLTIKTSDSSLLLESSAQATVTDGTDVSTPFRIVKPLGESLGVREVVVEIVHRTSVANVK